MGNHAETLTQLPMKLLKETKYTAFQYGSMVAQENGFEPPSFPTVLVLQDK